MSMKLYIYIYILVYNIPLKYFDILKRVKSDKKCALKIFLFSNELMRRKTERNIYIYKCNVRNALSTSYTRI